ncbi:MAG TPA: DUF11 domain-containing protein [Verrucomicrobiae bacterium]|jgi:uncharacterized repeat protein (TIGR01451 family)|nr:DUF11 domain-containing protein [Verrucomicrobiae bacterium]
MKRPASEGLAVFGLAALLCFTTGKSAFGQESCPLSLPEYPSNELSSYITVYPGYDKSSPLGPQQPLTSWFVVDVTNDVSGATPPIPYGLYAGWCADEWNVIDPTFGTVPGELYSGVLYSTCDPNLNDELPPGHANTLVSSTNWQMVNYILNHQDDDFYWDVQAAISTLVGSAVGSPDNCGGVYTTPAPSGGCDAYPVYDPSTVLALLTDATNNYAAWFPQSGDVVGAIYVTTPASNQFLLLEVPYIPPVAQGDYADLALTMTGAPNPVEVSNQLTYTLYVTNMGPTNASDVVLTDTLPASVTFSSATVSQGSPSVIPGGLEWNIGALGVHGTASATVVVVPFAVGMITNTATVSLLPQTPLVLDTNLANNTASVVTLVIAPPTNAANLALGYGTPVLNPQTGLFDQTVTVSNISGGTALGVIVAVEDLASNIEVYNATGVTNIYNPRGLTNNAPYVEYNQPLPVGSNVVFLVEYYEANRLQPLVSTNFYATALTPPTIGPLPTGTQTNAVTLHFVSQGQFTIEFSTTRGHTYVVEYSSSLTGPWLTAGPPIVATNNRTQWVDDGPPVTASPPGNSGERFYRIVEIN